MREKRDPGKKVQGPLAKQLDRCNMINGSEESLKEGKAKASGRRKKTKYTGNW